MISFYFITSLLGLIKNYIKYKQVQLLLFIRSPILCYFIQLIIQTNNIYKILIYERWFMFLFKIFRSLYNDDYNTRKSKYIKKYQLKYIESPIEKKSPRKVGFK
jgi:hypothetical protein